MPRNYQKKEKLYTEVAVEKALEELDDGGKVSTVANKYNIARTTLFDRWMSRKGDRPRTTQGRRTALPKPMEEMITHKVRIMAKTGFGPTGYQFREIMRTYLMDNDIENTFNDDTPGYD